MIDTKMTFLPKKREKAQRRVDVYLIFLLLLSLSKAQSVDVIKFAFSELPAEFQNPLTGFYPYGPINSNNLLPFPATLEFIVLPLNSVLIGENKYNWASFEQSIASIAQNGRQAVVRFYLDYPGLESGIPLHLISQGLSVKTYRQNGNCATCSKLPDYSNGKLTSTLLSFIREFGSRYNGDRRIGIIQIGLIGFWGEWHTWPLEYNKETFPSTEVQASIIQAYASAFPNNFLQIGINVASLAVYNRYSNSETIKNLSIGYSDDSIFNSYYSTFIRPILLSSNTTDKWRSTIIGGEIFPPIQSCVLKVPSCIGSMGQLLGILKNYRTSVALFQRLFNNHASKIERDNALKLTKTLGYRYYIDSVTVYMYDNRTQFTVKVVNNGLTRSYFPLYLGLDIDHVCYFVTKFLHELEPDKDFVYNIEIPFRATKLPFRGRFFLHAPEKIMPSQVLYLSNSGVNNFGDLYFSINPRATLALPWFSRSDGV